MTVPTVVGVSTDNAATTAALTDTLPSHQADDILIQVRETNITGGLAAASGWAHITNSPRVQGSNVTSVNVYWKRATSSAETNPQIAATTDHQVGFVVVVRGCIAGGNPWDFTPVGSGATASTSVSATGGTSTVADTLVMAVVAESFNAATDQFSAIANASLTNLTTQNQAATTNGNGGGIAVITGTKAVAGATGSTTATLANSCNWSALTFALRPAVLTAASGQVDGVSAVSGAIATLLFAALGQVDAVSGVSATAKLLAATSGQVDGVSAVSGAAVLNQPASGTVAAVSDVSGSVDNILRPVDAQLDIVSGVTGEAGSIVLTSGTAAATSAAIGSAALLTPASGTVAAVSDAAGSAQPQIGASGQVDVISEVVAGSPTLLATATGTVTAVSGVSGAAVLRAPASGTVAASSAVSGAATALKTASAASFNAIVEVFGSATVSTAASGVVDVVSGVIGSAGIASDITLSAVLAERTWSATLTPRTWEASL